MSIASEEACKYEGEADLEACTALVANQAYFDGRTAPLAGEEIEAVARLLFALHPMTAAMRDDGYDNVPEHVKQHYRTEGRWILLEARSAVSK